MDKYISLMNGYEFEEYCANLLQKAGFYNIQRTKLSGDFGIDIIAERNGNRIGIQCKRYSNPVGVQAVQEAVNGSIYYKCNMPMVLSNQDFTQQAREMAHRTNTLLIKIDDLIKISQNPQKAALETLMPSTDELKELALKIFVAFKNNGVCLNISDIQIGNNETVIVAQKEQTIRLNKIFSVKNEVAFEINVDYEKQSLLFIFNHRDIISEKKLSDINNNLKIEAESKNDISCKVEIEKDELLYEAGKFIIENNKASIGMLQHTFKIGFNRASIIMEQLEQLGVVGQEDYFQPRQILMTMEDFTEKFGKNQELEKPKGFLDKIRKTFKR